jgi:hypothetical protein
LGCGANSNKIVIIYLLLYRTSEAPVSGKVGRCRPVSRVLSSFHSDGHSSGSVVTRALEQPTRSVLVGTGRPSLPIWPCSHWGLPCHERCRSRGELLPHRFTLACVRRTDHRRSALCCTFRRGSSPRPGVTWQCALWSPDFPRAWNLLATIRPTASTFKIA